MCDVHLSQEDFGVLVTCATRYAIGRQSYMPYLVTGIVSPMLDKLDDKTLGCLIRDIEGAPSLGAPEIDKPMWERLLKLAQAEKEKRKAEAATIRESQTVEPAPAAVRRWEEVRKNEHERFHHRF